MPVRATTRTTRGLLGLVCVAAVALTTACGSSPEAGTTTPAASAPTSTVPMSPGTPTSAPSAASEFRITIKDFMFMVPDAVPPGATVTVVNDDSMSHTVTSTRAGAFDVTIAGGATETFTAPGQSGSYDFSCNFHGNMTGTLVVS